MSTKLKILVGLTTSLVLGDQLSKVWVVRSLRYSGPRLPEPNPLSLQGPLDGLQALGHSNANPVEMPLISGFLSFIHAQNPGAAMGMFNGFEYRLVVFYVFTAVALGVLVNMYKQLPDNDRLQSTTIALILSGAVGNFIDRVHKSTVTDFVRVYTENEAAVAWLRSYGLPAEYPTWNVADACIVVGVALYLLHYLFFERDKDTPSQGASPLEQDPSAQGG
jgi:signal peptidase II